MAARTPSGPKGDRLLPVRAMGPDLAMMMGPAVAVQRGIGPHAAYKGAPVVVVTGDAGMAYSLLELDTFVKNKLPVICVVYNNDCWGTYTMAESSPRALHMYLFRYGSRVRFPRLRSSGRPGLRSVSYLLSGITGRVPVSSQDEPGLPGAPD